MFGEGRRRSHSEGVKRAKEMGEGWAVTGGGRGRAKSDVGKRKEKEGGEEKEERGELGAVFQFQKDVNLKSPERRALFQVELEGEGNAGMEGQKKEVWRELEGRRIKRGEGIPLFVMAIAGLQVLALCCWYALSDIV
eukprot:1875668-Rhodomonas_salina.1